MIILVDGRTGSKELIPYLQRISVNVKIEQATLEYGDACFEGNGPMGRIAIGIERKTLSDLLNCVDDARYSAHQRPGMMAMYQFSILMVEGVWKQDSVTGYLMECVRTLEWRPFRYRTQMVRYSKLFRYLLSLQVAGTTVITTRDMEQTAYNILECYHWFSKRWEDHTSLLETQKLNMPSLNGRPTLVRRWASELDGVGVKLGMEAEKRFKTAYDLSQSDESDWVKIEGIGAKLARSIIQQIHNTE
jgi:ERCC4-type nuclease